MKAVGPDLPLACTLDAAAFEERRTRWETVCARALIARTPVEGGVSMRFHDSSEVATELRELMRLEGECCAFLTFRLDERSGEQILSVTGPPEAAEVLETFAR